MANKKTLQKYLIISLIVSLIFILILSISSIYIHKIYTRNVNRVVENIINTISIKYPDVSETEIMSIINTDENILNVDLRKYGIDIENDSLVMADDKTFLISIIINILLLIILSLLLIFIFIKYNNSKDKKINEITRYIKAINKKDYTLDISDNSEEELSILKNEIGKIIVMLKEQAELSLKDKISLKDSLSDISHQLKTPLTSITIMLDNLIDNLEIDKKTQKAFLNDIRKDINSINFLVQSLLKLSKFDANTIIFKKENVNIEQLLNRALAKLDALREIKNIDIINTGNHNASFMGDYNWEVEALTNIIKNCIDYSYDSGKIEVSFEENDLYSKIIIQDYGMGMDKEDVKNLFKRFHKGKNNTFESVGIGMSLAKTIIEKDNGYIKVTSKINEGTCFEIRYLK